MLHKIDKNQFLWYNLPFGISLQRYSGIKRRRDRKRNGKQIYEAVFETARVFGRLKA